MKIFRSLIKAGACFISLCWLLNMMASCNKTDVPASDSTKEITYFSVKGASGSTLDTTDVTVRIKGDSIVVWVPFGTDLADLIPSIAFNGDSITIGDKVGNDVSQTFSITVIAEDNSTRKYTVVITVMPIRNMVFVGGSSNKFYALNAVTGALKWEYTSTKPFAYSVPAFKDSVVYVGGIDNYVYAFHALTGEILWKFKTGAIGIEAPVTISSNTVYVGCNDDIFYALDAQTGSEKWRYVTGGNISTGAVVLNGTVYFGSSDGKVYALNAATGALKWSYSTGGMIGASGPVVKGGVVFVGSRDNYLYALNAATGALGWRYNTGVSLEESSPTVVNGVVYIAGWYNVPDFNKKGSLYAVNATTGALVWESLRNLGFASSPVVVNGRLYITNDNGDIAAVNISDGSVAWSKKILPNGADPVVANGLVFVGGGGSWHMYAFDAVTGVEKWKFALQDISLSGAMVIDSLGLPRYPASSGMMQ